jgi:CHAD domain-containing protein
MAKRSKPASDETSSVQYAGHWMERLRELVPAAVADPTEDAVHDARVATRRLKAALDIAGPLVGHHEQKVLQKVLRKLRKRLGPMRDADVMLGHLAELGTGKFKAPADWLVDRVTAEKAEARKKAKKKLDPADTLSTLGKWWGVEQAWSASLEEVDARITQALLDQLDDFARRADAVFGPRPDQSADVNDDRDPHALRIAGKSLRYTVEIAAAAGHPLPIAAGRTFKKMQDALGLWHDYVVLAEYALTESVAHDLVLHNPALQAEVLNLASAVISRATRQLEHFHQLWKKSGPDLVHRLRRAMSPPDSTVDSAGVPSVETGPDLFDSITPDPAVEAVQAEV